MLLGICVGFGSSLSSGNIKLTPGAERLNIKDSRDFTPASNSSFFLELATMSLFVLERNQILTVRQIFTLSDTVCDVL
jgi:hypothetical protein